MKALVCVAPGRLHVEDRPRPHRADGEVLIRIRRAGICGTDYHIFTGDQPFLSYPRLIGHELAGEVVEAPPGSTLAHGLTVTVNPYVACGSCVACRRRRPNCCARISVLGVHADGGMCEWLAVPERAVVPADGLTLDQAAMVEFLAIGAHAVRRARLDPDMRVLVVGAGPIGVATALFARVAGARSVTVLDTRAGRLAFARDRLGFASVVAAGADQAAALSEASDGEMFDAVFDATGNIQAMRAGLAYVAHAGTYVLVGLCKDDLVFPDPEFHKRETTLLASRNALAADFDSVIAGIRSGAIPADVLATHRLTLDEAPARIPALIADADRVMKAIVSI
jgi:2-desacetyl-2-hydroxyethyl bacteriochlorophyllide A dehydrogenase